MKYSALADEAAGAGFGVDDGLDRSDRELLPFDPLPSSQDDIQLDHFIPFQHYLPKRNKRQAPVSFNNIGQCQSMIMYTAGTTIIVLYCICQQS